MSRDIHQSLAYRAMQAARHWHWNQQRRYNGEPYITHLAEVVAIAATATLPLAADEQSASKELATMQQLMAVAWLHDCREDQQITAEELLEQFGPIVEYGVTLLSELDAGNRATRKALARDRLAGAPAWVQTIKCADVISNAVSIARYDPMFFRVYRREGNDLLAALTRADPVLHAMALAHLEKSSKPSPVTPEPARNPGQAARQ